MNKNYYFDMDGVVVTYNKNDFLGDNPLYLKPNAHYFRNLTPDRTMLEVIDQMYQRSRYTGDNICLLTSLPIEGSIFNEHFHDKIAWINQWLPYLPIDSILISVTSKREAAEYINNNKLSKNDILIDDYNKNLNDWAHHGGVSIKYCNGINSPESFQGKKIYHTDMAETIITTLNAISE